MGLKKILKEFNFNEQRRSSITLGPETRLNPRTERIQLKEQGLVGWIVKQGTLPTYPTDDDLYVKTWVTNPTSVKQWIGFDVEVEHTTVDLVTVTSVAFRLSNGTDEYWFNGSSWEINVVDWNTETEVANNISTFPVVSKNLQVIINLKTSNKNYTPKVDRVKVLYDSDITHYEDYIARSFIPMIRSGIRPMTDYPVVLSNSTDTVDLINDYPLETPYNLTGVFRVYNLTDDPEKVVDIYQSYDDVTQVITLSEVVAAGKALWIQLYYELEVALATDTEFYEIAKVPAIYLADVDLINDPEGSKYDYVRNKDAGTAVKLAAPIQGTYEIKMEVFTDTKKNSDRVGEAVRDFFRNNKFLTSVGLDESFSLVFLDKNQSAARDKQNNIHVARFRVLVSNVLFFDKAIDAYLVTNLNLILA